MTIGQICEREVDLANPFEHIVEGARRMREKGVGTLVVLDEGKRPVGILTDRDVAMRVVAEGRMLAEVSVGDVMTAHPRTVSEETPVEDALAIMRELGVRRMLVTGGSGELVGIVSLDDVLALILEEFRSIHGIIAKSARKGALVGA